MAAGQARCRWHTDGPSGRCTNALAFPGVQDVPELCAAHLAGLDRWITARAAQRANSAADWISWARRQAEGVENTRRALGEAPVLRRPRVTAAGARP